MINKEIEEAKSILSLFSSDEESRAYQADITYAIEGILQYIEQLETKVKKLGKGQHTLMQSRRKWKNRYYKEKRKNENNKQG